MKLLILSDIHGNKQALQSVLNDVRLKYQITSCALLGDLIDYGMHSNEVVSMIKALPYQLICNIRGNHEDAIIKNKYEFFSSERGRISAKYTREILDDITWDYLFNSVSEFGRKEFIIEGKKCLAVHGSLENEYWESISTDVNHELYAEYDYVFSGHSHLPHYFEKYVEVDNPKMRNKKKIVFINPGSVGQPRNLNNRAQYAVLDTVTEEVHLCKVEYDIKEEQNAYNGNIDEFYKERLELGI